MLGTETTTQDFASVRPWLAWIERAIGASVQFIGWNVGESPNRRETMPVILGSQRFSTSIMLLGAISEFRRSNPPESIAAGTPHPVGQVFRQTLGGVPAIIRVGSQSCPLGVLVLSNRGCAYTSEELNLVVVASQRISEAVAQEALQDTLRQGEELRVRVQYERDALVDFARGLAKAPTRADACRLLLLFALGLTTSTGGYVAIEDETGSIRIAAVRGHVLVAKPDLVRDTMASGEPAFPPGGIILPIRGVQTCGYLVLSGRLVGTGFGEEDLPALEAACAQAGMALDRAAFKEMAAAVETAGRNEMAAPCEAAIT
jgi:hypothetical protein